jgi:hypothetical protein
MPEAPSGPGCDQIFATGAATRDGRLLHARMLDWYQNAFILAHPTLFVKEPDGGMAHVIVGFPANLSPYSGMNAAGLSFASNEIDPHEHRVHGLSGRSHVQMMSRLLTQAGSLDDAEAFVDGEDHISSELIGVADGNSNEAGVFEMSPEGLATRTLDDDLLYATNHFNAPTMTALDLDPTPESSQRRFDRLSQLLPRDVAGSSYGALDGPKLTAVLRDRIDPWTLNESPLGIFDNGASLATNGALYAIVFSPSTQELWVASGAVPVPSQTFVGFSLKKLLSERDAQAARISDLP